MDYKPVISMVASATSTEVADARADSVVKAIRSGRWSHEVERVRAAYQTTLSTKRDDLAGAKERVSSQKRALPGIMWSGHFTSRAKSLPVDQRVQAHSGLLCADLDHLEREQLASCRAALQRDPHVFAFFLSPTGTGLKVVFRVPADVDLHEASFRNVQEEIRQTCGVEVDGACRDLARLCFVSFDEQAFLNTGATELPVPSLHEEPVAQQPREGGAGLVETTLPPRLQALVEAGAPQGERNERCLHLACQLRDEGLTIEQACPLVETFAASCSPPMNPTEAVGVLRNAYARPPRAPASEDRATSTSGGLSAEEDVKIVQLSALAPVEYDRVRKDEAQALGIRVSVEVSVAVPCAGKVVNPSPLIADPHLPITIQVKLQLVGPGGNRCGEEVYVSEGQAAVTVKISGWYCCCGSGSGERD